MTYYGQYEDIRPELRLMLLETAEHIVTISEGRTKQPPEVTIHDSQTDDEFDLYWGFPGLVEGMEDHGARFVCLAQLGPDGSRGKPLAFYGRGDLIDIWGATYIDKRGGLGVESRYKLKDILKEKKGKKK